MNPPASSAPDAQGSRAPVSTVLCDLDGVVWLARRAIPGAAEAVARLRDAGCRVLFVTNNSGDRIGTQEDALAAIGIPAAGDVVTSAMAAARFVEAGDRVYVCGGDGIREALAGRGATVVEHDDALAPTTPVPCDAVMVGIDRSFTYRRLAVATTLVRAGARLIATNTDATYPTPDGPIPGGGAIVAAVATAAGVEPHIAGKPHRPMADAVAEIVGDLEPATTLMVGDRPATDGAFARTLGCRFALVRSGVTAPGDDPGGSIAADLDLADLAAVAATIVR